jgi:anti-anti-sigma factor
VPLVRLEAGLEWQQSSRVTILPLMELLRLEEGPGPASFRLIGELDYSNVPEVTARLQDELRAADQLTLDTSGLRFMDSQGLHMLIELGAEAARRGTSVALINSSKQVKRLLDVAVPTGITGVEIVEGDN